MASFIELGNVVFLLDFYRPCLEGCFVNISEWNKLTDF